MADGDLARRDMILTLAGLGLAGLIPGAATTAAPRRRRIDFHYHHVAPEWITDADVQREMAPNVIDRARAWTAARAIEEMDRNDVSTVLCSVSNPGVWFGDVAQGRRLSRICNQYAAGLARDYPGRFGLFAALPLPDIEGSLAEIAFAFDQLHADGVGLFTSYGEKWLPDPAFAPVLEELNRRKAVIYCHPMAPSCCRRLMPGIPAAILEYPIDTSRTMLQWIMTGSSARYPDLRLIFSHAGGLFMAGLGRLQILSETQPDMGLPTDIKAEVAKFYYEISSSADEVTMRTLRSYVGASRIVMGTDSPFIGPMRPNLARFETLSLSPADRAAIEHGNAQRLMPGLE